ncbi:hypothetical protein MPSEU_000609600 [Mayamaea pseudoterrestris]|nr:hypothetical protein MPSEU_000609600 [Mayamaea pseudoterrestris]
MSLQDDSDVDMADLEDIATRAAAKVRASLQSFSSSRHYPGTFDFGGIEEQREWLRSETESDFPEEQVEDMEDDNYDYDDEPTGLPTLTRTATPQPKRQSNLERSNTPVMSNQSKKQRRTPSSASSTTSSEFYSPMSSPYSTTPSSRLITQRSIPSGASSHIDYLRFYEATLAFVNAKRLQSERQSQQLHAENEKCRMEVDFLQALQRTCWENASAAHRKQGNFWLLLSMLRKLGIDFLLWNDASDAKRRRQIELEAFKEELADKVSEHPKAVLSHMSSNAAPGFIRRHALIIRWLEACFHHVLPSGVTRPRQVRYLEDSLILKKQGLPETDKDAELFECSLALLLAGRNPDAQMLWKDSNVPWRAIVFTGEEPLGYQQVTNPGAQRVEYHVTGNDRRPLWRRFQWIKAAKMAEKQISVCCEEQGAIHAVLGCNLQAALQNPTLRSWEKGLYVTFRSVFGRLEDEILHRYNNHRRAKGPYPGTQFETSEIEHLAATSDYSNWEEGQIIDMLKSTPYPQMQCDDPASQMTAKFLIGESAVIDFLHECITKIEQGLLSDESFTRFFVHLLMYLDVLSTDATLADGIPGVYDIKNRALQSYLRILAARDDLWYMRVLYASMLPTESILDCLPPLLLPITSPDERRTVVEQLHDHLLVPDLDTEIIRIVVDSILNDGFDDIDPDTPTQSDLQMMDCIKWLSFSKKHLHHALEFTNTLFRQFLLAGKMASAELFVENTLRDDEELEKKMLDRISHFDDDVSNEMEDLKTEYAAYLLYLKADFDYKAWIEAIATSDACPSVVDDQVDPSKLDSISAPIARQMQERELIQEKRAISQRLKVRAHAARESLAAVLAFPGGWLLMRDDAKTNEATSLVVDNDESRRHTERIQLRSKILPKLVLNYYQVCSDTAAWMSRSLNDAVERLNATSHVNMLMTLDESYHATDNGDSALAPWYWTAHAMDLADTIVSEAYDIQPACTAVSLKEFADVAAEIVVNHLMYESSRK